MSSSVDDYIAVENLQDVCLGTYQAKMECLLKLND